MPQMMPLSWLTLFFMFSVTFLVINTLSYFIFPIKSINKEVKINLKKSLNWKW